MGRLGRVAAVLGLATLSLLAGRDAEAQTLASLPRPSEPAAMTGEARPIAGWVDFCSRHPAECEVDRAEAGTIALSPRTWALIVSVNRKVNATIRPMTDVEHWGMSDRWDLAEDGFGDCEDYQLLKRKLLVEAGLPRRALRMTVVIDEKREGHAVLMVRTSGGDFVLDNKTNDIQPWFETGYTFVKRESQDAVSWVSLGGAVSPVVTANR